MARTLERTAATRVTEQTYQAATARARQSGQTLSGYLHSLILRDVQQIDQYMLQTAARSSQATLNVVLHLLAQLAKDPEAARALTTNLSRQMDASFGRQKAVPEAVSKEQSGSTDGFIADILAVYDRHSNFNNK